MPLTAKVNRDRKDKDEGFWLLVIGGSWHGQGEQNRKKGQCKGLGDKRRDRLHLWE